MPNPARRAVALAALAAAIIAAAVALDLAPVAAQSDDEQTGRIVAQRLADGRTEFGWQPAGGERILPRARYFPADAQVGRWLRSSPVEVDGAEIGRINARLRSDGRIEFAFTPTDGERIAPSARYFPANARVNRWLRSTEITISAAPAAGFVAVSGGGVHTCGLRTSGAIECWGDNEFGQADAPAGSFTAISAGIFHTCGLRESGEVACWGLNREGQTNAPAGRFSAVSAGSSHNCGLRDTGEIECWGRTGGGQHNIPSGSFSAVSAGFSEQTCAIAETFETAAQNTVNTGELECWGGQAGVWTIVSGRSAAVAVGAYHTCAIDENGAISCWGEPPSTSYHSYGAGQTDAPKGGFAAIDAGGNHTCAIRESGAIECWGQNLHEQTDAPAGSFIAVSAGELHTCAIRESGAIECWGWNYGGQADVPAP